MKTFALLCLPLAATLTGVPLAAQEPEPIGTPTDRRACAAALFEDATAEWLTDSPATGDFTMDGGTDAAIWGERDGQLIVLVARCEAARVAEQWRLPFDLGPTCAAENAVVGAGSLLLDRDIVDRVCARGARRDECIHLQRENESRQRLMDAGARELRVDVPGCVSARLRWDRDQGGFIKLTR